MHQIDASSNNRSNSSRVGGQQHFRAPTNRVLNEFSAFPRAHGTRARYQRGTPRVTLARVQSQSPFFFLLPSFRKFCYRFDDPSSKRLICGAGGLLAVVSREQRIRRILPFVSRSFPVAFWGIVFVFHIFRNFKADAAERLYITADATEEFYSRG